MSVDSPQKRQRQTGSFSPASPPYHLAAKTAGSAKTTLHQQPDTPTSPPYMSSTTPPHSHASTASLSTASAQALTPPSSANMSQASQPNTTNSFPTPASSAGTASFAFKPDDCDVRMTDDRMEGVAHTAARDVEMGNDGDHRHTGHDRTGTGSSASGVGPDLRLQSGSGPFYKLSETPYPMSRPHVSQDLVALYGLNRITQSVARFDPKTGEKINKLRKSYESHVKDFKISGGKSRPEAAPGQLMGLLHFPDEEYYLQRVRGNEMESAQQRILAKLNGGTLKMNPGKLSKDEDNKWKTRIGTDEAPAAKRPAADMLDGPGKKLKPGQVMQGRNSATSSPAMRPSPATKAAIRPDRAGKKRSYLDSSFKGYGEGFGDDDGVGESTGGEDNGRGAGAKKKRRKDFAAGSPLGFDERRHNVGMVGVRH
ncbi:rox3 family protein [Diplodia corticola]|uniref:Mediator of RNA polymerase II transcription subunit 19 n=1 Tax=Diplodia corticola TaxID=236234 RepID=A0A1J9SAQ6_9PEZI|nr:rox3 family protein [Diplodia corticola]OJD37575.1 rox3 family protein [Diplodia corticola]